MVADTAQARTRQRLVTDAGMGVGGNDQLRALGNRVAGHNFGVLQHVQGNAGSTRSHGQTIVLSRGHDADELYALFVTQRLKN